MDQTPTRTVIGKNRRFGVHWNVDLEQTGRLPEARQPVTSQRESWLACPHVDLLKSARPIAFSDLRGPTRYGPYTSDLRASRTPWLRRHPDILVPIDS